MFARGSRVRVVAVLLVALVAVVPAAAGAVTRHHTRHRVHHRRTQRHAAATHASASCANSGLVPDAANLVLVDAATLCLVNQQRAAARLSLLSDDATLDRAAQAHSQDMIAHDYFDHVSPTGSTPLSRLLAVHYLTLTAGYWIGENIAWGTLTLATPASIVGAWMQSPDHRANILRPEFRQSGIGIVAAAPGSMSQGESGATYTQDFGAVSG